jgi:hypothetical protein
MPIPPRARATAAAEAAGMSRVTLHRIERGEPSVTPGAYLSAIDAVGLQLELRDPNAPPAPVAVAGVPARVRLGEYPRVRTGTPHEGPSTTTALLNCSNGRAWRCWLTEPQARDLLHFQNFGHTC